MSAPDTEIMEMLASLVLGEARLLGMPITLAWPDGLPSGWTESQVQELARTWRQDAQPQSRQGWVRASDLATDAVAEHT